MKQKSSLCKHYLHGYCRRKNICGYIHETAICQNHRPTPIGDSKCQDTACELRHPRLCAHFMRAQCHFGTRCLLFHPVEVSPALPHPVVTKLQQDMEEMRIQIMNLKEEVKRLKDKPPADPDPGGLSYQQPTTQPVSKQPKPDLEQPPPDPDTDTNPPASLLTTDPVPPVCEDTSQPGQMESKVSVNYNCGICFKTQSYDQLSPDILSILPQHIKTAAKRKLFLQKLIDATPMRMKCHFCYNVFLDPKNTWSHDYQLTRWLQNLAKIEEEREGNANGGATKKTHS